MWLCNGLILIAYLPSGVKQEVHNGMLLQIMSFDPQEVKLKDIESGELRELKLEFVRSNLRLAYAFTNVGCQGRSLANFADDGAPERGVTLWNTDSWYFSKRHLFTGTSRCRAGALLQVT